MFGLERDCLLQGIAPLPFGLPGQGKHQVDADVGKSSAAKNMKRLFRLCGVMLTTQQFNSWLSQLWTPRLIRLIPDSQRHAFFTETLPGFAFNAPLAQRAQIEYLMKSLEQVLQLDRFKSGRCPAAKEYCFHR